MGGLFDIKLPSDRLHLFIESVSPIQYYVYKSQPKKENNNGHQGFD